MTTRALTLSIFQQWQTCIKPFSEPDLRVQAQLIKYLGAGGRMLATGFKDPDSVPWVTIQDLGVKTWSSVFLRFASPLVKQGRYHMLHSCPSLLKPEQWSQKWLKNTVNYRNQMVLTSCYTKSNWEQRIWYSTIILYLISLGLAQLFNRKTLNLLRLRKQDLWCLLCLLHS